MSWSHLVWRRDSSTEHEDERLEEPDSGPPYPRTAVPETGASRHQGRFGLGLDSIVAYATHPSFELAVNELRMMLFCRSPRFQLRCLAKTTKTLFSILGENSSADDFLPLFIYCAIRSDCSHLGILTDYINKYRNPKELVMGWDWKGASIIETGTCLSTSSALFNSFLPSIRAVSASIHLIINCTGVEED